MPNEPQPDEPQKPTQPEECSRRKVFEKLGLGCMACAGAGSLAFGYEFLSPNVLYEPSPITNAGKPDQYALGSVTTDAEAGIYIIHGPEGFYALSATCTHLGCRTAWSPELGLIACPCHGSRFNLIGIKVAGPAPRPLPWLKVSISDEGDLIVDRSDVIPPQQFLRT
jgi:cytochrome b6-f complex iron-sulfur subunit